MIWKISIRGRVQGVGFRPFVWRAARSRQVNGCVSNGLEGVSVLMEGTEAQVIDFKNFIVKNCPETAHITAVEISVADQQKSFDGFSIVDSEQHGEPLLHLTPDVALCDQCRHEMYDPQNQRYHYPFTTCTTCGPRYSILTGLPYDRPLTTMRGFTLCKNCLAEYHNPADRRYFAQTNSCPDCGIHVHLYDSKNTGAAISHDQPAIRDVVEAWQKGAIVAIKGNGGYLLTCDAANPDAIATLRQRKHRPTKPLALMYPDLSILQGDARVPLKAVEWLSSAAAPVVLLDVLPAPRSGLDRQGIAPGLHKIGAMLPNTPLFDLLLHQFGGPVVATSGNISHAPLIYQDENALAELHTIADFFLTHDRPVSMPQDDSVLSVGHNERTIVLRRARGLAPSFIQKGLTVPEIPVLALGAEMKNTFTVAHRGIIHTSQYLGDLENFDVQQRFHLVLDDLQNLLDVQPAVMICDLHPGYFTTQLATDLAAQQASQLIKVQHHKAHFAAVLAENQLFKSPEPVLGIIWDGTGYGEDGQIWGGEFFIFNAEKDDGDKFSRAGHFAYFPVLLGDKMPREPRLSALAVCQNLPEATPILEPLFTAQEWALYSKIVQQESKVNTSGMGRIFDAVAALLGLAGKVSYEGEAALLLEDLARQYVTRHGFEFQECYLQAPEIPNGQFLPDTTALFRGIVQDIISGQEAGFIAARFHWSLVKIIARAASVLQIKKIAFSGGVFQNMLLVEMAERLLTPDYQLFFHKQLSPNDENISFGQWAYCLATHQLSPSPQLNPYAYVSGNSR